MTKDSDRTSSQQDFLANLSVSQEKENLRKMTEISGRKLLGLSKSPDPLGLLEKTLMESLNSISTPFYRTWRVQTTPQGALIFQLRASVLPTKEKESGLLPTPRVSGQENPKSLIKRKGIRKAMQHNLTAAVQMYPTPIAGDAHLSSTKEVAQKRIKEGKITLSRAIQSGMYPTPAKYEDRTSVKTIQQMDKKNFNKKMSNLATKVRYENQMYPTPNTRDTRRGCNQKQLATEIDKEYPQAKKTGGRLNPNFVERLMGFPTDWTRIEQTGSKDSETQSFHKSHTTSDKS
jgi:hypothetical protein